MMKTALSAILITAWLLTSCGGEDHAREVEEIPPVTASTTTVEAAEWPDTYESAGTVRATTAATISAKLMGYVKEVRVDAGDRVKSGQILLILDARDIDAGSRQAQAAVAEAKSAMAEVENAIAAAKAQMELANATFARMKGLYDKKSISEQEFDEVTAKKKMAEANYQMAVSKSAQLDDKIKQAQEGVASSEIMKSYAEITAPFDGIVTEKMVEPGNLSAPGAPLLTIEQAGAYRLEARVEESRIADIRMGQEVTVTLDALGKTLEARVNEIVPAVDAASRTFTVKINLPRTPQLRSGSFGRATFSTRIRSVVAIPEDAVLARGQVKTVYVVEAGHARARLVSLGSARNGQVEVLSGLSAGERIVAPVPAQIVDGAPVEVRP
jgi:multidrug efflux system membrane fusion protein